MTTDDRRVAEALAEIERLQAELVATRAAKEAEWERCAKYLDRAERAEAEHEALRALLAEVRPFVADREEDVGYGYARPANPHDFSPDQESCTPEEIAAHRAACEAFDRGEFDDRKTPRSEMVHDDNGATLHILRAPWGIGTYVYRDPQISALLARIDAARKEGEG